MERVEPKPSEGLRELVARRVKAVRDRALSMPAVARSVRAVVFLAAGLRTEPITLRAAALTYLSVLSLVPLLAVSFSMFAVFGSAEDKNALQSTILNNLAIGPTRDAIASQLSGFVRRASGSAVGGVGFALLIVSAVSLMTNIEAAFNATFRAPKQRPLALRFGIYWCLLTLGPILLAASITATAYLGGAGSGIRKVVLVVAPFLVTYAAFTLLYIIVPAVQVKRRAAVLGALVAGTAWEIAKILYAALAAATVQKSAIYGSLSAIPIFLVWVYISWIIVLFGARIAYAAQAPRELVPADAVAGPLGREVLFAHLVEGVARAFHEGRPAVRSRDLAVRLGLDEGIVRPSLEELQRRDLVREIAQGGWVRVRHADGATGFVRANQVWGL